MRRFRRRGQPQDRPRHVSIHVPGHCLHKDDAPEAQAGSSGGTRHNARLHFTSLELLHVASLLAIVPVNVFHAFYHAVPRRLESTFGPPSIRVVHMFFFSTASVIPLLMYTVHLCFCSFY